MNYLSVENISKAYGDKPLFENLTFGIQKGDKVAMIAANGAGKTTIMRILNGKEEADTGRLSYADGLRIGFLEQEPVFEETFTIRQLIDSNHTSVLQAIRSYEAALDAHTHAGTSESRMAFEHATSIMDTLDAWTYEQRLTQLLSRYGIQELDQQISTLSGGQRKRLALALVLLDEPDLLLLDEPTNHLDLDMIEGLEKYLRQAYISLLMVTHDRYFLDRVCNNIMELFLGQIYQHKGNYSYYLQKSAEREEAMRVETEKAGQLLKQELDWMRRQPKARTTKSKSRIDAFYELKQKAQQRRDPQQLKLEISMNRMGGKILEMRNVNKVYGDIPIIRDFDYIFTKGERIGIIGPNGVGKTTFLNLITGLVKPDKGRIITGDTLIFGYYTQGGFQVDDDKRIIDVVKDIADVIPLGNGRTASASQFLAHFKFPPKMQQQTVSLLSGGEKRRLYLLTVLVKNPNFLILDEPTNDLDLMTLQTVEDFLQTYQGCLMVVSHDRWFMDEVVDQLFVFQGDGKVKGFMGSYSDYKQIKEEREKLDRAENNAINREKPKRNKTVSDSKKRTYKEQKEFEVLEKEIAGLEAEKAAIERELLKPSLDYKELEKNSHRLNEINQLIDDKTFRWLELDELA
jgi:ATP-binding cassette subfamily F protein uup